MLVFHVIRYTYLYLKMVYSAALKFEMPKQVKLRKDTFLNALSTYDPGDSAGPSPASTGTTMSWRPRLWAGVVRGQL